MLAMVLEAPKTELIAKDFASAGPGRGMVLLRVLACGVCRTDLHLVDGELPMARYPIVPGHQIVGRVEACGDGVTRFAPGDRVGVPWLGWTCGECEDCRNDRENLCRRAKFTGCHLDGGYAERVFADERFCIPMPASFPDAEAAPLLCAGLIGYRSLCMAGDAKRLGLYGFGAAAHIITQVALWQGREIYAFTRPGDEKGMAFARELGAAWAGGSDDKPPEDLDAAIIFAPVGALVPEALRRVRPGGRVVCGGIAMSDIPSFPYEILWEERSIVSVANLTRRDAEEFFSIAPRVPVQTTVTTYPLARANDALDDLRHGRFEGAAVLVAEQDRRIAD